MRPHFSIIVPVYNVASYLDRCIQSLVIQKHHPQIILVDDGSTDGSGELCEQWGRKYKQIQIFRQENKGLSGARNTGLQAVTGDYVLFVDSDDILAANALEELAQIIETYPDADFIHFGYLELRECRQITRQEHISKSIVVVSRKEMFSRLASMGGEGASVCTKLYKSRLLQNLRFKEKILNEDEFFTTQLLCIASKAIYTDAHLYYYMQREGSIVTSSFHPKKMDVFISVDERIKVLDSLDFSDLADKERLRSARINLNYYYLAKEEGYYEEARILANRLNESLHSGVSGTNFTEKILFNFLRRYSSALELYYLLRRLKKRGIIKQSTTIFNVFFRRIYKNIYRFRLKNKNFCIISNNCWGGFVYQELNLPYNTPTIGLFIMEQDYIKFLENLPYYLSQKLNFIDPKDTKYYSKCTLYGNHKIDYPVALLDDVEIWFMHYKNKNEAESKWKRRVKRMNFKYLLIKMSQRQDTTLDVLERFKRLPFKNKICFIEPGTIHGAEFIEVPELIEVNKNCSDETQFTFSKINIINILNNLKEE